MVLTPPGSRQLVHERVVRSATYSATAGFYKLTFQAMSTVCRVHFRAPETALAKAFQSEVLDWVAWFESQYSRFISDSLIGRINQAAGLHWVDVDPETDAIFDLCQEMIFLTRGVFDPTSLPLIRLWNWKARPPVVPDKSAIQSALELVGWRKIQRRKGGIFLPQAGMCLDLGGIGKEYAVDRVMALALNRSITNVMVDFGQDVRVHGEPPERGAWHVGLEDPKNPGHCWIGVAVNNHAVATSGDYLRHYIHEGRRYGHIIDPRDGHPVNNGTLSVSVIAPYCTMAGILSTAICILGPQDGLRMISHCQGVEGCITTDKNCHQSPKFYAYTISSKS